MPTHGRTLLVRTSGYRLRQHYRMSDGRARHGRRRTAANTAQQNINLCGGGVPFSHLPCVLCFFLTFPYSLIDRLAPLRATAYATSVSCPPLGMFVRAN